MRNVHLFRLSISRMKVVFAMLAIISGGIGLKAQIPEGKWYLQHVELNEASTDPMQSFAMEKLFKREEGKSYLQFNGDTLTYYSLLRGEVHYSIKWSSANSYYVLKGEETNPAEQYQIDWLSPDEVLITFSGNNSLSYYRKEREEQ